MEGAEVNEVCFICGADCTHYFDKSRLMALCDNTACEVALVGEITSAMNAEEANYNEGAEP